MTDNNYGAIISASVLFGATIVGIGINAISEYKKQLSKYSNYLASCQSIGDITNPLEKPSLARALKEVLIDVFR